MRLRCVFVFLAVFHSASAAVSADQRDESAAIRKLAKRGIYIEREEFSNRPDVLSVRLIGNWHNDDDLQDLFAVPNLSRIEIQSAPVTDLGAKHLAKIKGLTNLKLCRTQISDAGLQELSKLTQLDVLILSELHVTDVGARSLKSLNRLTTLCLKKAQITDEFLENIGTLTRLQSLVLTDNKITDQGLQHLVGLKHLQVLNLERTQITDRGREFIETELRLTRTSTPVNGSFGVWHRERPFVKLLAGK